MLHNFLDIHPSQQNIYQQAMLASPLQYKYLKA